MRTIRYAFTSKQDPTCELEIQTEVIINDDDEAREAGAEAQRVVQSFLQGMLDASEDDAS